MEHCNSYRDYRALRALCDLLNINIEPDRIDTLEYSNSIKDGPMLKINGVFIEPTWVKVQGLKILPLWPRVTLLNDTIVISYRDLR